MDAKAIARAVLPRPAVEALKALRFSRLERHTVDAAAFPHCAGIDLTEVFANPEFDAAWREDNARIETLIGSANLYGGINPGDRKAIYFLVLSQAPTRVLEVGTHIGISTLYVAMALRRLGGSRKVTTVDIFDVNDRQTGAWREIGLAQPPCANLRDLGLDEVVDFVDIPVLEHLWQTTESYDFIFLDGDHRSEAVYHEVAAVSRHLMPNGMVLMHDYYPRGRPLFSDGYVDCGPWRAGKRLMRENPDFTILPLGPLPWSTKLGSQATSLAMAVRTPT